MKRREFITLLGGVAAAWPLAARAQQQRSPARIGVLLVGLSPTSRASQHFRRGLRDAGYFEGRDVVIEWRSAEGDYNRVPGLASDLVRSGVDVIVLDSTSAPARQCSSLPRSRSSWPSSSIRSGQASSRACRVPAETLPGSR